MPSRESTCANCCPVGKGWRPGPPGEERSRSRSTNTAPGRCPSSYLRSAGGGGALGRLPVAGALDGDQRRSTRRASGCACTHPGSTMRGKSDMRIILHRAGLAGDDCLGTTVRKNPGGERSGAEMSEVERLLVVDDEAPILHALQRTFEAAGYEVCACSDPAEALERLREKPYQVLSADYMM